MATPEDVEVSLRRWAEMGKAERWMHTIDFTGPEDALELVCGDLEERGYTFVVGASEKDNGQEWPEVRAESQSEELRNLAAWVEGDHGPEVRLEIANRLRRVADGPIDPHRERLEAALSDLLESIDNLRGYRVNGQASYLAHVDAIYQRIAALARGELE